MVFMVYGLVFLGFKPMAMPRGTNTSREENKRASVAP